MTCMYTWKETDKRDLHKRPTKETDRQSCARGILVARPICKYVKSNVYIYMKKDRQKRPTKETYERDRLASMQTYFPKIWFPHLTTSMSTRIKVTPKRPMKATTATHCNTLQHTATHCNTLHHTFRTWRQRDLGKWLLQHTATYDTTLHNTTPHYNTLQHTTTHRNILYHTAQYNTTLQHTTTHRNTLYHTTTYHTTLQHTFRTWQQRSQTGPT